MNSAVISIGSNIEPEKNVKYALSLLSSDFTVTKITEFIRTKPVGLTNQPDFLNGAVLVYTDYDLETVEKLLKKFEKDMGRIRTENKFGPRQIDFDVIVWNDEIIDEDVYSRDFLQRFIKQLLIVKGH